MDCWNNGEKSPPSICMFIASNQSVGTEIYCESNVAVARLIIPLTLNLRLNSDSVLSINVSITSVKSDRFKKFAMLDFNSAYVIVYPAMF